MNRRPTTSVGGRAVAAAKKKAESRLRLERLRQLSLAGASFDEAVASVGMTRDSVKNMLWRHEGSRQWPIA